MIKEFKIHSNYLIEGANVKVSWKTKHAFLVKFHIDSWIKGWFKKNSSLNLFLDKNINKITLYAIGFGKIEKKEIKIKFNKYSENYVIAQKIKNLDFQTKKNSVETIVEFNTVKKLSGIKKNNINLKSKKIKVIINYNKLKLENHE